MCRQVLLFIVCSVDDHLGRCKMARNWQITSVCVTCNLEHSSITLLWRSSSPSEENGPCMKRGGIRESDFTTSILFRVV